MDLKEFEENIELRVFLLAIFKRADGETFKDVIGTMEESRVFDQKTGKKYLKQLKAMNLINDNGLTMIGLEKAKNVEMEFKI